MGTSKMAVAASAFPTIAESTAMAIPSITIPPVPLHPPPERILPDDPLNIPQSPGTLVPSRSSSFQPEQLSPQRCRAAFPRGSRPSTFRTLGSPRPASLHVEKSASEDGHRDLLFPAECGHSLVFSQSRTDRPRAEPESGTVCANTPPLPCLWWFLFCATTRAAERQPLPMTSVCSTSTKGLCLSSATYLEMDSSTNGGAF